MFTLVRSTGLVCGCCSRVTICNKVTDITYVRSENEKIGKVQIVECQGHKSATIECLPDKVLTALNSYEKAGRPDKYEFVSENVDLVRKGCLPKDIHDQVPSHDLVLNPGMCHGDIRYPNLDEVDLPLTVILSLKHAGIVTLEDLVGKSASWLLRRKNFGEASLRHVNNLLKKYGMPIAE